MNLQQRRVVVDTSVISHIFRQDEIGVQYRELLVGQQTLISFQTLAEQLQGAYSANWGQRRIEEFRSYLERYTVIWPDDDLVETYARVVADCSPDGVDDRKRRRVDRGYGNQSGLFACYHRRRFFRSPGIGIASARRLEEAAYFKPGLK